MILIDIDALNVNINKLKFYLKEEQLAIDSLDNFHNNGIYISNNMSKINEFKENIITNLKLINKNHYQILDVLQEKINKYIELDKATAKQFEMLGDINVRK